MADECLKPDSAQETCSKSNGGATKEKPDALWQLGLAFQPDGSQLSSEVEEEKPSSDEPVPDAEALRAIVEHSRKGHAPGCYCQPCVAFREKYRQFWSYLPL